MRQRIAIKALIINAGKILLLREADTYGEGTQHGRYHLPGGRVEVGEPFEEALNREIMEETGLTVEVGQPFFVGEWRPEIKGEINQIIGIFFLCNATSDEVKLSTEHDQFVWIEPTSSQDYDVMDPDGDVIKRYLAMTTN